MKLEAKSRLLLTANARKFVQTKLKLVVSDGRELEFKSGQDLDHWVTKGGADTLTVQSSFAVGHYLVVIFSSLTGVAKAFQTLWVDTDGPKPGSPFFESAVANERAWIKKSLEALKRSHHPMLNSVKKDADEVLAFYEKHNPTPDYTVDFSKLPFNKKKVEGRRTQGWFHRLSAEEQDAYCEKFPGTRFRHKRQLVAP